MKTTPANLEKSKSPLGSTSGQPTPVQIVRSSDSVAIQLITADDPRYEIITKQDYFRGTASFLCSTIIHAGLIIFLSLATFQLIEEDRVNQLTLVEDPIEERERELEIELDELDKIASKLSITKLTMPELGLSGEVKASIKSPELEIPVEDLNNASNQVSTQNLFFNKQTDSLLEEIPLGSEGSVQSVVEDYDEAMDQITQEIIWLLSKSDVLVIWLFDQSESMKDDQQMIKNRIHRVYAELDSRGYLEDDALTSAVASYGNNFLLHTRGPTTNQEAVKSAIDKVPVDPSGEEFMCSAVLESIKRHRRYANITKRKIALILVTDESGNTQDNRNTLENAIAVSKSTETRVYILGREAIFGYPYAHVRWTHPYAGTSHLLQVDRGPETATVEQLQTDGFGIRRDAMASGFGPFEQVRMARETGGIFFMLPGQEETINEVTDRKYRAEQLAPYQPELNARLEQMAKITNDPLKQLVTKVIYDLNPYNESVQDVIQIRQFFSKDWDTLKNQVREQQAKMFTYIQYLDQAIVAVEKARVLRDSSESIRWQANYDLLYGQLLAYRARAYEYGAYLTLFVDNPPAARQPVAPYLEFTGWRLTTQNILAAEDKTVEDIALSKKVLEQIMIDHEGTPWATRAASEIKRGFGVKLVPTFFDTRLRLLPRPTGGGSAPRPPIQIPKL